MPQFRKWVESLKAESFQILRSGIEPDGSVVIKFIDCYTDTMEFRFHCIENWQGWMLRVWPTLEDYYGFPPMQGR